MNLAKNIIYFSTEQERNDMLISAQAAGQVIAVSGDTATISIFLVDGSRQVLTGVSEGFQEGQYKVV